MGLSQDEIDKLATENQDTGAGRDFPMETLLKVSTLFTGAIENIVPVLAGSENIRIEAKEPFQRQFDELIAAQTTPDAFFMFTQGPLTSTVLLGSVGQAIALEISQKMMGQEGAEELNEALLSALTEAFNNILGAFDSALAEDFVADTEHGDLKFFEESSIDILTAESKIAADAQVWYVPIDVTMDDLKGKMGLIISDNGLNEMTDKHPLVIEARAGEGSEASPDTAVDAESEPAEQAAAGEPAPPVEPEIQKVAFEDLEPHTSSDETRGVNLILDVPLMVTVELGRKTLPVRDILSLTPGSLVELEKLAGEAVDLLVNGKLFARGEVVVIDENFGVRVSAIISPTERIQRMGEPTQTDNPEHIV